MIRLRDGLRQSRRVIPSPDAPVYVEAETLPGLVLGATDISEGGMELELVGSPPVRIGDELALVLRLPREAALRVVAQVRHMDLTRIGVVFADLPPGGREAIRRYVSHMTYGASWWRRLRELWQE